MTSNSFCEANVIIKKVSSNSNIQSWNNIIKQLESILKNAGPRLQIQFNDKKGKCINRSIVLKPIKKKLDEVEFVPVSKDTELFKIPSDAAFICVFGQCMKFAGIDEAEIKMGYKNQFNEDYQPTQGIEITDSYLGRNPRKSIFVEYNLNTHERTPNKYFNDIIQEIIFENGFFKCIKTSEPIISI